MGCQSLSQPPGPPPIAGTYGAPRPSPPLQCGHRRGPASSVSCLLSRHLLVAPFMLGLGLPAEVCPDASLGALEMEMYRWFWERVFGTNTFESVGSTGLGRG